MPSWLVEDPTVVYFILGTLALALLSGFWSRRKRWFLYAFGVVLLLIVGVWLLDYLVVTDREEVLSAVQALARRVQAMDVDGSFEHLSDQFTFRGVSKEEFRKIAKEDIRRFEIHEMHMWDLNILEASREKRTARVEFHAKVQGNWRGSEAFYLVQAEFVLDKDGKWRMRSCEIFQPFVDTKQPAPIPGLP